MLGAFLRGSTVDPHTTLPPNVCGQPPAAISAPDMVDDWRLDPQHPVGYLAYPPLATARHEQGQPVVAVCIMPDGWVGDAVVKQTSGSDQLDAAALISAGNWHFLPAAGGINGVPEWADIRLNFVMPDVPAAALPVTAPAAQDLNYASGAKTAPVVDPAFPHRASYPLLAWRHQEEGTVTLSYEIMDDGWPSAVKIVHSSGSRQLDAMAIVAVGYWHYFPATKAGTKGQMHWLAKVNFRLANSGIR
ncbi:MAG TPA: energy transducer TonB [Rhizomicrobium sp.]|nr:energy transducer TonB [Rhizomicrobium sp.]